MTGGPNKNEQRICDNACWRYIKRNSGILVAFFLLLLIFATNSPAFLTNANIINVLRQVSINTVISCGMTYVILLGGIDLSVGSMLGVSGCLCVWMAVNGIPIGLAMIGGIAASSIFGLANGVIISKAKLPPFIVTLAMMEIGRGTSYIFTGGKPTRYDMPFFDSIGNGYVQFIPIPVIIMIVIVVTTSIILSRTKFGRHIYGVGGSREAARFSGIKIDSIEIRVYTICGLLAGIAGIIMASRLVGAQPTAGNGYELDAIAAVVLGGTSMTGGVGTVGGTVIGALIIGILNNGLNLLQVPSYWQKVFKGLIIIVAVYIDSVKNNKSFLNTFKGIFNGKNSKCSDIKP
ncbi:MAG: ABC transporter permease [Thermacetogeniaceae bacterium]|jgi:ribose transport system permease protein